MALVLDPSSPLSVSEAGGKGRALAELARAGFRVPPFVVLSTAAFEAFARESGLRLDVAEGADLAESAKAIDEQIARATLPEAVRTEIVGALRAAGLLDGWVAVRSSGVDEDSADSSFAGMFSSFLFQREERAILECVKRCWASAFSERALGYRRARGLPLGASRVAVVLQRMVDAEVAGVAFSRNVVHPYDRETLLVSSAWGLGEGVVSGEVEADEFTVARDLSKVSSTIARKTSAVRAREEGGVHTVKVATPDVERPSLSDERVGEIARLALALEQHFGAPQDCEWAIADGAVHVLQSRPITSLPPDAFFDGEENGAELVLWDNSNIIESFCGVTSPLTFSHASRSYRRVYRQFCEVMGVPPNVIKESESIFANMLGLVRGRMYYNLVNWYRMLFLLPGAATSRSFMETMMGVRQSLTPEQEELFRFTASPPRYSVARRLRLVLLSVKRYVRIDDIVSEFRAHVLREYDAARALDLDSMSLRALADLYRRLEESITGRWQAPIINDARCMVFFGLLRAVTTKWAAKGEDAASLQNDLLCGTGDLESVLPTRRLMDLAREVEAAESSARTWFLEAPVSEVIREIREDGTRLPAVSRGIADFIERWGFRCVNELKLEELDLHDDPSFAIEAIRSYVRTKSYSTKAMEERERTIRTDAEALVRKRMTGLKRTIVFWILGHARRAVRDREDLRFLRTKTFGLVRTIFRAIGRKLARLGVLEQDRDVFCLTVDEVLEFVDGRAVTNHLPSLVRARAREFDGYRRGPDPPDRFFTRGAVGANLGWPMLLSDAALGAEPASTDPNLLTGTPCCPGVVEGAARVVTSMADAKGLGGEILVTERTDPGWVPLFPSCSGLIIARGSLLSHSAVVARELGLPTIVGVSGGLLRKLQTGMRVRMDGGKGTVRISVDSS